MAVYGQDLYGKSFYGVDPTISFSVGAVSAVQTGYGEITLYWNTPSNTENWSTMRLVRNTAGYPASEDDGDVLLEIEPGQAQNVFTDSGLIGGRYYYYAFFLASAFPAYSASMTYQPGDTVSYGGSNWVCTTANTLNVAPGVGVSQWSATNAQSLWNRAGQGMSLAVADYGYRDLLYNLTPAPYATDQPEVSAPEDEPNSQLARYLAVLAWALDMTRTELGEQQHLHRVSTMPLDRMEHLAKELGAPSEASITPRLRRYRVANSAQLARRKGTLESIKEAVYATTGYDVEFDHSMNRLLDADQSEFRYPRYPVWDRSVTYQPGEVVSYNGYLYSAVPSTLRVEAENATLTLNGAPSSVVQNNSTSAVYSNNKQVLIQSNAIGQGATLTFSIATTGTYDLSVSMTRGKDYAISEFSVDGVTVNSGRVTFTQPPQPIPLTFDAYAPTTGPGTSIYLGSFTLSSGTHTIGLTAASKNAKSGTATGSQGNGYQIGVDYIAYTPKTATAITGIAPSGAATNNSFWTYYTAAQTHGLDNPLTGGISTWEQLSFTAGATANNSSLALYSGYPQLNGVGDNTANRGVMTNGTGVAAATLGVHSIPHAQVTAWSSTTTYARNAYVSYNGVNYLAILPSLGAQPDVDVAHWQPETIATSGVDRFLVSAFGLPLAHTPMWSPGSTYTAGQVVQYQGQRYVASAASHGISPTGQPTDNTVWSWTGDAQATYTASAWTALYGGGTTTTSRSMYIEWYDASGSLITTISPTANTRADLLVPFARDSANLVTDAGSSLDLNGMAWTTPSTDTPVAYSGLAYWGTRNDASATGRHLVVDYLNASMNAGITFVTAPPAGIEHGLIFRWSTNQNFWAASRTRLTKTVSGVLTTVASWSALADGSRIFVTLQGSAIAVYKYQGPGLAPIQLASVTDTDLSTNTRYGIFERAL